ncbi:MAG TPA: alpha/beta hydrolase [Jiangellales bacterium]|nr:alpha/beta hydrolase [Jiangellales bacterium]
MGRGDLVACLTVVCLGAVVLAGCGAPATVAGDVANPPQGTETAEYRPGVDADVYLPSAPDSGPVPVVVTVPGGSWATADRTGLGPLATALAAEGMVVVNARYRAAGDGVAFPTPVEDVACAVSWASARAEEEGFRPEPLVLAGHSAGAHLAALAALAPGEFRGDCPGRPAEPDAFVGLAGPYELAEVESLVVALFGAAREADPAGWDRADPIRRGAERPELGVLLLHGTSDDAVAPEASAKLATALREGGHDVTLTLLPGVDHDEIYTAATAAPLITDWITGTGQLSPTG